MRRFRDIHLLLFEIFFYMEISKRWTFNFSFTASSLRSNTSVEENSKERPLNFVDFFLNRVLPNPQNWWENVGYFLSPKPFNFFPFFFRRPLDGQGGITQKISRSERRKWIEKKKRRARAVERLEKPTAITEPGEKSFENKRWKQTKTRSKPTAIRAR